MPALLGANKYLGIDDPDMTTATVVWDRHSDRRDSERTDCDLDIQFRFVSRDSMDEELRSSTGKGMESSIRPLRN